MTQHILTRLERFAQAISPGKAWAIRPFTLTASARSPEPQEGVNLASESVAGEEDPGASLDMAVGTNIPGSGTGNAAGSNPISEPPPSMNPGDEAPPGTPGTGEGICRECGGSGRLAGARCPACDGSGKVIVGVGGA